MNDSLLNNEFNSSANLNDTNNTFYMKDDKKNEEIHVKANNQKTIARIGKNRINLPSKNIKKELDSLKDNRKQANVLLSADIEIAGDNSKDVVQVIDSAAYFYKEMIKDIENLKKYRTQEEKNKQVHTNINSGINSISKNNNRRSLLRQESIVLLKSFDDASSLLDAGVEQYVKQMRKLLKTDIDTSIEVNLLNVNYKSKTPILVKDKLYETVSSQFFNIMCGLCYLTGRSASRVFSGKAAMEFTEKNILTNVTCNIKPSRLTLVLGPPASGKSSLLKAIAGKLYNAPGNVKLTGDVYFNNKEVIDIQNIANWVAYVSQHDEHQPTLTTRETLDFAFKSRKLPRYNDENLLKEISSHIGREGVNRIHAYADIEVDIILALLGLNNAAETVIGDATLKGVSGGEKRRVTLGEMLVTGANCLCLDEISTGLDSASTYDICQYLKSMSHIMEQTAIVALLQPPPEVIDLFDDIIVIAEGQIIYHGERSYVLEYFESLGFKCPPRKDLGDFLQELPTKNGKTFRLSRDELKNLNLPKPPTTVEEFAQRWKESKLFQAEKQEVEMKINHAKSVDHNASFQLQASYVDEDKKFNHDQMPQGSFFSSVWLLITLVFTLRIRAKAQLVAKVGQNIMMGLFYGSLFYQIGFDEWYMKSMLLYQIPTFTLSSSFPMVQVYAEQRAIFYKQLDAKIYTPFTFVVAQSIVSMPFVLFDILVFGSIVYFMCGLALYPSTYLMFFLLNVSYSMTMTQLFLLIPFTVNKQDTAVVVAVLVLIMSLILSGVVATPSIIPDWIKWAYSMNPLASTYTALAINEYHSGDYEQNPCNYELQGHKFSVNEKCGDYFLKNRDIYSEDYRIPLALGINIFYVFIIGIITTYVVGNVRFDIDRAEKEEEDDEFNDQYLDAISPSNLSSINTMQTPGSVSAAAPPPRLMRQNSVAIEQKVLVARNLGYTVPIGNDDIKLLNDIDLWALPGRLTALMGSSGAGKTTLLDVLAGRKTVGKITGDIMINGELKVQEEFVKYSGYVEQFGNLPASSTIEEAFYFSADLRLDPIIATTEQKQNFVKETLDLLELTEIKNSLCGSLSMEQNKRTTLGLELVANPSIIFCDEPTSGLDARAAAIVMRVLQKVARSGRTVICTIHQPSIAIFQMFDDLLLLKRGGKVVYFGELGENSQKLIDYFEIIPTLPKCEFGYNPATWMLEIIGAGTGVSDKQHDKDKLNHKELDFAQVYLNSDLGKNNQQRFREEFPLPYSVFLSPNGTSMISDKGSNYSFARPNYSRSQLYQLYALTKRFSIEYWRSPDFTLNRILVVIFFNVIFGGIFWQQEYTNVAEIQSRLICIFFFVVIMCIYSMYVIIPVAISRRAVYYRERATGMYSLSSYVMAEVIVEVPWLVLECFVAVALPYYMIGLKDDSEVFMNFVVISFLLLFLMSSIGLLFSSLLPDALAAQLAAIALMQIFQIFSGILVPEQNLPSYYHWLYRISVYKYALEYLFTDQFHDDENILCVPYGLPVEKGLFKGRICTEDGTPSLAKTTGIPMTAKEFVEEQFLPDYDYDNHQLDILVCFVWIVIIRILTLIVTLTISHNKR